MKAKQHTLIVLLVFILAAGAALALLTHANQKAEQAASEAEEAHNEDEIRILMEESHKHGYIDKTELTYLDNVFDFSDRRASDIMVPRTDMICLYLEDPIEENIQTALD